MTYESWRLTYQDPEQAAKAAYAENARLKKDLEQFQMALREQVELNKNLNGEGVKKIKDRKNNVCPVCEEGALTLHWNLNENDAPIFYRTCDVCHLEIAATEESTVNVWCKNAQYEYEGIPILDDVKTVAYMHGVAEGKKHTNVLVAAAYRAAANKCLEKKWWATDHPTGAQQFLSQEILALTPADAEKALREFGLKQVLDEQIVDEVLKK